MKICQVNPGLIEIPPKTWGAVEKIIYNYKLCLEALFHTVDIKLPDQINPNEYDIVHVHTVNQALMLHSRGIPYIFHLQDHHVVRYGKNSQYYQQTIEAINKSILTIISADQYINYFGNPYKLFYLSHGVDSRYYLRVNSGYNSPFKLLCVANTGYLDNTSYDRKGLGLAIQAAQKLNLSITIAGPTNYNKHFFDKNLDLLEYDKLNILYDLNEKEVYDLYNTHDIFIHPSELEMGQPNLTILEALSMGLPVVGTYNGSKKLLGIEIVERNVDAIVEGINRVSQDHSLYRQLARQTAQNYDFLIITKQLLRIYEAVLKIQDTSTTEKFKSQLIKTYSSVGDQQKKTSVLPYGRLDNLDQYFIVTNEREIQKVDLKELTKGFDWNKFSTFEQACCVYQEIFNERCYDYQCCYVEKGDVVIDIGANLGLFSRYAFEKGASRIYAIEAEKLNFECLNRNCVNISTNFRYCVEKENDTLIDLFVDKTVGGHSIFKEDVNNTKTGEYQKVRTITLDKFIKDQNINKIDFLKVDTEGAEFNIFAGISDNNLQKIRKITFEYHHQKFNFDDSLLKKLIERLQKLGFEVYVSTRSNHLRTVFAWKETQDKVNINFINGAFCEILGPNNHKYNVTFVDKDTKEFLYQVDLNSNNWARTSRKYFTNYQIQITNKTKNRIKTFDLNLRNQRVYICFESKSLGDNIGWIPYVEEFRLKHSCNIICSTFWNDLFIKSYPNIQFIKPGEQATNIVAQYNIGLWTPTDKFLHPNDPRLGPLQKTASDILGLEYKEIRPKVNVKLKEPIIKDPYITISTAASSQFKYWNYDKNKINPWQYLIDYFNSLGIKTVLIQTEKTDLQNLIVPKEKDIQTTINYLLNAKFHIGLSSGTSWLTWALNKKVVIISGFTKPFNEFESNCIRIYPNQNVCKGCWNDERFIFDAQAKGDWMVCPFQKNTPRQFECSKVISPELVISKIKHLL